MEEMLKVSREPRVIEYPKSNKLTHEYGLDELLIVEVIKRLISHMRASEKYSKNTKSYSNTENNES